MLANKLMSALSGGAEDKLYVDDVFSAYTYTDNASIQTITNGIDLAGKGGLVWTKRRGNPASHLLLDTVRGGNNALRTDEATANLDVTPGITFGSSGYTLDQGQGYLQVNGNSSISWTFRKAPKFFDVVTWTGNDLNPRVMNHSLGASPGMMIVKTTSGVGVSNWNVYHRSLASPKQTLLILNTSDAASNQGSDYWIDQNESSFIPSSGNNFSGRTYVAYLFAHDPSADGIIQCGSYTGNGSTTGPIVNLGWEPQYLMIKNASGTGNWQIIDSMRGMPVGSADATLQANLVNTESSVDYISPTATGFQITSTSSEVNTSGSNYIYLAIRRPNKPPTTGTEVYNAIARTGTGAAATVTGVGFALDLVMSKYRDTAGNDGVFLDRLRGNGLALFPATAAAETNITTNGVASLDMGGFTTYGSGGGYFNNTNSLFINHFFRRAPGFMDVVCYTGNSTVANTPQTVSHSLGVKPEIIILKGRANTDAGWLVGYNFTTSQFDNGYLYGNNASNPIGYNVAFFGAEPTSTTFSVTNQVASTPQVNNSNYNNNTYVAYLFASLPGISKVGSYTGNGTTQTINCGFTTGARFILIKRTDSTGDWYIWDTARGIVAGNDPHLSLNTYVAEVTTDDSVDPDVSGFIVNQVAATNINVSGGQYIFLAIA